MDNALPSGGRDSGFESRRGLLFGTTFFDVKICFGASLKKVLPVGLEPTTTRLKAGRST